MQRRIPRLNPQTGRAMFLLGVALSDQGDLDGAVEAFHEAAGLNAQLSSIALYNVACLQARSGRAEEALQMLAAALNMGFADRAWMRADDDIERLKALSTLTLPAPRDLCRYAVHDGAPLEYLIVRPEQRSTAGGSPMLIAFGPGSMSRHAAELAMDWYWGQQAVQRGWTVVSPLATDGTFRNPASRRTLHALIDSLIRHDKPPSHRVHLAGCSNGGIEAFRLASEIPDRVCSLTVLPGYAADDLDLVGMDHISIAQYVGAGDSEWLARSRRTHERLVDLGCESTLTIVRHDDHFIHSRVGEQFMSDLETRVVVPTST